MTLALRQARVADHSGHASTKETLTFMKLPTTTSGPRFLALALVGGALLLLHGCAAPARPMAGVSEYESLTDADWEAIASRNEFEEHLSRRLSTKIASRAGTQPARLAILALSGGGQHGAFGAGVLEAWPREASASAAPTAARPSFDIVTGVSTGALQATAAFLDEPELNGELALLYSTISDNDVYERFSLFGLFGHGGAAKYTGLARLLEEIYDNDVIDRVAAAYDDDRTLWVGTCNMDSGAFVPWNLTYIAKRAASGNPDYYELYRKIVLASASIPGAVEPQFIRGFMHVDGGTRRNVFLPTVLSQVEEPLLRAEVAIDLCVIVNGKLGVAKRIAETGVLDVAGRAIEIMIDANVYTSLVTIWESFFLLEHEHPELDLDLSRAWIACIPPDFIEPAEGVSFDQAYMTELVDFGRTFASEGRWITDLPDERSIGQVEVRPPDSEELEASDAVIEDAAAEEEQPDE